MPSADVRSSSTRPIVSRWSASSAATSPAPAGNPTDQDGTDLRPPLPEGLELADRLPEPIFTPSTKEDEGHDENIPFETVVEMIGEDDANALRDISLKLYTEGAAFAAPRGVILADTKFEFGMIGGKITLIDEALTPDSSRFWPAAEHKPGARSRRAGTSRSCATTSKRWTGITNRRRPPLPREILDRTSQRYHEVLEILFPAEAAKWQAYL